MYPEIERFLLTVEPDESFISLQKKLSNEIKNKHFSKDLFIEICRWKSTRKITLQNKNSTEKINVVMSQAFNKSHGDKKRIDSLCTLDGVAVPTASAFLTMFDSNRYGVIDLHAWRVLHRMKIVTKKPSGKSLSTRDYITYLNQIRAIATNLNVTPRLVDISLMKENQRIEGRSSSSCA